MVDLRSVVGGRVGMRRYYVITGALSLGYGSIYTLLADLRDRYGFSEAQLGVIAGAGFFAGFLAQSVLARHADRGRTALMVRGGALLATLAMVGCAVAKAYWAFVLARVLLGLGSGVAGPALRRLVILREPEHVGRNLGTQASYDLTGFVLGPLIAGAAAQAFGLRAPFILLAAILGGVLLSTVGLDLTADVDEGEHPEPVGLLRQRAVLATVAVAIAFYTTIGVFEAVWSVLLRDRGAETWLIGLTLSLFTVPMIFLAPIGGRVAHERGPLRTVVWSVALATVCTFSYGAIHVLWILLAVSLVHAVADSFTMPGNQVGIALATPRHQLAAGQGLLGAAGLATAGVVGIAAGAVYEAAGPFVLFTGTAVLMSTCIVVARVLAAGTVLVTAPASADRPAPAAAPRPEAPTIPAGS